ncbi:MAG: TIGR02117 family protein [Bacteroidota bacterium]
MKIVLFSFVGLIGLILGLTVIYFLLMILGMIIPVNRRFQNEQNGIMIFLHSNGVHTDFILPAVNHLFDWRNIVNPADFEIPMDMKSFVGIGWGDRGFYLDTPTWAELKLKTALTAALVPSPTVMHITSYLDLPNSARFLEALYLDQKQYETLCNYILQYFRLKNDQVDLIPDVGYTCNDNFYTANGAYHAFNTCNFWINRGLNISGVRTALWSPFDRGIFYQLGKIRSAIKVELPSLPHFPNYTDQSKTS